MPVPPTCRRRAGHPPGSARRQHEVARAPPCPRHIWQLLHRGRCRAGGRSRRPLSGRVLTCPLPEHARSAVSWGRHILCKAGTPVVPGPYTPPQPRRTQVVRSRRGAPTPPWRWWWLVPVAGLVPLLVAVLATQGAFSPRGAAQAPVASAPTVQAGAATAAGNGTSATGTGGTAANGTTGNTVSGSGGSGSTAGTAASGTAANGTPGDAVAASPARTATSGSSGNAISGTGGSASAAASNGTATSASAANGNATGGPYVAYHVQAGDTVRFIARTYGVSPASIIQ